MRKGLTLTLMTAAIALIGLQAMAMAPVIKDIPSPIVGNENSATNPTTFVYADAINLDNYVTDDTTSSANVIWSYVETSNTYKINGVAPLDLATDDPTLATGKRINGATKDPADVDGKSNTITVRNAALTPISGSATRTPGANGANNVIASEIKTVTLFASDGTTYSSKDLMFYTDNGGNDRLSPGAPTGGTPVWSSDFSSLGGFAYTHIFGTVTSSTANSTKLCLQTVAGGDNMGYWHSPFGTIPLVDNAVYHIRMTVNSTQTVANTVPLWDLVIINSNEDGSLGKNLYGGDFLFFDNVGGANAALASGGRNDFDVWWCPTAIKQEKFRSTTSGAFSPAFAADKDARFQFRVLDNVGNAGIHADQALGSICLDNITIERYDLSQMQVESNVLNMTSITDAASNGNTHVEKIFSGTTATFANGAVTVRPNAASEYASVAPGDTNANMSDGATLADNWPAPIVTDGLYQIVYGLSAPTANDVTNSPDVFWVSADVPSMEVIQLSFVTNWLDSAAMPQVGTPQDYIAFYSANAVSKDPTAAFKFMRPRLDLGNNGDLKVGNNSGAMTVHSVRVDKVSFQ